MTILERVQKRLKDDNISVEDINEYVTTISDRLNIRLGESVLPDVFQSIAVDASVKMYRRIYYEGIQSEGMDGITTSFVDNVLAEYEQEIQAWKDRKTNTEGTGRVVRFL
ncbi:phage head-tail connector protein [Diplocloster modestus]|uniref:Uncharacterized protein n=1 Tax=Diplocloster modestus TaxID=2850322 RepID=A0ABS6KC04_9FIRM|nr:phage head-tail connector protein [Diplocloster modestus]MBU9728043.1 hypothetical protein [Diplocloster modestus]